MEQKFIDILSKLVKEQGNDTLIDAKKCKAFINDYAGSEYKKERRFVIQAVEAGAAKAIAAAADIAMCKKTQAKELEDEFGLSPAVAADIVNALAQVLRGDTQFSNPTVSSDFRSAGSGNSQRDTDAAIFSKWKPIRIFKGHENSVHSVAFSPNGKYIASVGEVPMVFSLPDGRYKASGDDEPVKLWEAKSGRLVCTFESHEDFVKSVAFSPDGKYIASDASEALEVWEVESWQLVFTIKDHIRGIVSVAFSPDGKYIASGTKETFELWEVESWRHIRTFKGVGFSVAFSPDSKYIASGTKETFELWEVESGRLIRTFKCHEDAYVVSIAFSPDGKYIVSAYYNTIILWEVESGRLIRTFSFGGREEIEYDEIPILEMVSSVAFSPDGKYIVSGDDTVKLWEVESGQLIRTFEGHEDKVMSVAFSPDGNYIVSGSLDSNIILWGE